MPYSSNSDINPKVRGVLPSHAQDIYRATFNSVYQKNHSDKIASASAWASVKRSYHKVDGKWVAKENVEKEQPTGTDVHINKPLENINKSYQFKIEKADNEMQVCFGWVMISEYANGIQCVDTEGDMIDPEELEKLAYKYLALHGDVGFNHEKIISGRCIESFVSTKEKQVAMGIPNGILPVGLWMGFFIEDKEMWNKIKTGEIQAFSIGGSSLRVPVKESY